MFLEKKPDTHPWSFHPSQYWENSSLSFLSEQHLQTLETIMINFKRWFDDMILLASVRAPGPDPVFDVLILWDAVALPGGAGLSVARVVLAGAGRAVATGGGAVEPHPVSVLVTILDPGVKWADPRVAGIILTINIWTIMSVCTPLSAHHRSRKRKCT